MPSNGKEERIRDLKDKLRSFFGPQNPEKKKNVLPPKTHFSIWYFLVGLLLFSYLQQQFLSRNVETISYGQFKQDLAEGNISKLIIGPDNINGTLKGKDKKPGQEFTTIRVDDPGLVKELDEHKVDYSGRYSGRSSPWDCPAPPKFR